MLLLCSQETCHHLQKKHVYSLIRDGKKTSNLCNLVYLHLRLLLKDMYIYLINIRYHDW